MEELKQETAKPKGIESMTYDELNNRLIELEKELRDLGKSILDDGQRKKKVAGVVGKVPVIGKTSSDYDYFFDQRSDLKEPFYAGAMDFMAGTEKKRQRIKEIDEEIEAIKNKLESSEKEEAPEVSKETLKDVKKEVIEKAEGDIDQVNSNAKNIGANLEGVKSPEAEKIKEESEVIVEQASNLGDDSQEKIKEVIDGEITKEEVEREIETKPIESKVKDTTIETKIVPSKTEKIELSTETESELKPDELEPELKSEPESERKIKNTFEIDNEEMKSYYDNKDRELTDRYKKKKEFKDSLEVFEKIAKRSGFGDFIVRPGRNIAISFKFLYETDIKDDTGDVVEIRTGIYKENLDKVRLGDAVIKNLKNFLETDSDFCEQGLEKVLRHEKQHTEGKSGEMTERMYAEIIEKIKLEGAKDFDAIDKISKEVINRDYPLAEQKAEMQRIENTDYKNLDEFIDSQAGCFVTYLFLYRGLDYYKDCEFNSDELRKYPGFSLIKKEFSQECGAEELMKKITERMEEMRKDLVVKYNDKFEKTPETEETAEDIENKKLADKIEAEINEEKLDKETKERLQKWDKEENKDQKIGEKKDNIKEKLGNRLLEREREKAEEIERAKERGEVVEMEEGVRIINQENVEKILESREELLKLRDELDKEAKDGVEKRNEMAEKIKVSIDPDNPELAKLNIGEQMMAKEAVSEFLRTTKNVLSVKEIDYLLEAGTDNFGDLSQTHEKREIEMEELQAIIDAIEEYKKFMERFEIMTEKQKEGAREELGRFVRWLNWVKENKKDLFLVLVVIGVIAGVAALASTIGLPAGMSVPAYLTAENAIKAAVGLAALGATGYVVKKKKVQAVLKTAITAVGLPILGAAFIANSILDSEKVDKFMEDITGTKVMFGARSKKEK